MYEYYLWHVKLVLMTIHVRTVVLTRPVPNICLANKMATAFVAWPAVGGEGEGRASLDPTLVMNLSSCIQTV